MNTFFELQAVDRYPQEWINVDAIEHIAFHEVDKTAFVFFRSGRKETYRGDRAVTLIEKFRKTATAFEFRPVEWEQDDDDYEGVCDD